MTIEEKFLKYDAENPKIWIAFERLAFQLIMAKCKHYSSDGILHKIRFESAVSGNDGFKINNIYSPMYARKFMATHPQYNGFFETRELISKTKQKNAA